MRRMFVGVGALLTVCGLVILILGLSLAADAVFGGNDRDVQDIQDFWNMLNDTKGWAILAACSLVLLVPGLVLLTAGLAAVAANQAPRMSVQSPAQWAAPAPQFVAQQTPTCPRCGVAQPPGAAFCGGCGGRLQA